MKKGKLKKILASSAMGIMALAMPFTLTGCDKDSDINVRVEGEYIQWQVEGEDSWTNLLTIDEIKDLLGESYKGDTGAKGEQGNPGINGKEVEFRNNGEFIQWRYIESNQGDDDNWENLIEVSSLKGDKGGPTFLSGSTNPSSTLGEDGDLYLNTTTYNIYKKTDGSWQYIGNIEGDDGEDGNGWHSGTGSPDYYLGKYGDFYLDTDAYDIYEKTSYAWTKIGNIKGLNGLDGVSWSAGNYFPSDANVGDLFLNTQTFEVCQKNSSGDWTILCNIKGQKGEDLTYETYTVSYNYAIEGIEQFFDNYVSYSDIRSTEWITNMPAPKINFDLFEGWYIEGTNKMIENYDFIGGDVTLVARYKTDNFKFYSGCSDFVFNEDLDGYECVIDRTERCVIVPNAYNDGENGEKPIVKLNADSTDVNSVVVKSAILANNGIKMIGDYVFYGADFTEINLPESLTTIGDHSFYSTKLSSLFIPKNVSQIASRAFGHTTFLTSVIVDVNNTTYDSRNNCNAIIETSSNTLIKGISQFGFDFYNFGIKHIGTWAFMDCSIKTISLMGVETIGLAAFSGCVIEVAHVYDQNLVDDMKGVNGVGGILQYVEKVRIRSTLNIENATYLKDNYTLVDGSQSLAMHDWIRKSN